MSARSKTIESVSGKVFLRMSLLVRAKWNRRRLVVIVVEETAIDVRMEDGEFLFYDAVRLCRRCFDAASDLTSHEFVRY